MRMWLLALLVVGGGGALLASYFVVTGYLSRGEAGKLNTRPLTAELCLSIPAYAYVTGNILGPPDAQTSYTRSRCFFELARQEHSAEYCQHVKERKSLFYDGSAYSPEKCRAGISEVLDTDAREAIVPANIHAIQRFQLAPGAGGNYSATIATRGSQQGRYNLSITLHDSSGALLNLLHQEVISLGAADQTLTRTLNPQGELIKDFGEEYFNTLKGRAFVVRAELKLLTDNYHLEQYKVPPIPAAALESRAEQPFSL